MKCNHCGFENNDNAKFCTKCGSSLVQKNTGSMNSESGNSNSKIIIIALIVIIIILVATIGFFALNMSSTTTSNNAVAQNDSSQVNQSDDLESDDQTDQSTSLVSSSQSQSTSSTPAKSKSWELIGSYSGSGSGSQTITVPAGQIMIKLSAYPIKNYATNHLYVTGSNGASGGVDWGSTSAVESRSDSFEYTSSGSETFTVDYYETVSWEVEFYRYQ